jgi:tRNA(adenine34) deaminase
MEKRNTSMMNIALNEARAAAARGEVPVGAVVSRDGEIIAQAGNRMREGHDPTGHAEIAAIRMACQALGAERLVGCDLHVTLEPCTMCAAAISLARIERLYFGADDEKGGAVTNGVRFFNQPTCFHAPQIYDGIGAQESTALLRTFFAQRRG